MLVPRVPIKTSLYFSLLGLVYADGLCSSSSHPCKLNNCTGKPDLLAALEDS